MVIFFFCVIVFGLLMQFQCVLLKMSNCDVWILMRWVLNRFVMLTNGKGFFAVETEKSPIKL